MQAPRPPGAPALTTLAASFGFFIVQLDVTIVNVALPELSRALGTGVAGLQWVVDAYALAFAVLLLSAGALGDRFGARRAYLVGFALFAAASLACGLAQDAPSLIAARAAKGIGAALLVPSSLALLNHAYADDPKGRAHAIAAWTAAGGVSIALGPVLGGLLLATAGWRSIFLVNLPVCLLGAALTLAVARPSPRPAQPRPFDLPGQLLAALALTGLIAGVIEAQPRGLGDPLVLGGLALFLVAGAGFLAVERRVAAPAIPLEFFARPGFTPAVAFGVLVNLTYYGTVFVLALYLQQARGWTPIQAGLAFLPLTATFIVSNVASGWVMARFGLRFPMVVGAALAGVGYALLLRLDAGSPFLDMLPAFILIPGGMGLGVPAMTTTILASVEREWAGTASAVLNAARQAAGAIGVAAFGVMSGAMGPVGGLHGAATASTGLLAIAVVVTLAGVRRSRAP
jgi:DHA2 family methylenomycin A resistance protein-like MFS transporter